MAYSDKRDRGILSEDDREFLRGNRDLTAGSTYNAKRRIRERIRNGILDFTVLFDHLDESERKKIFETEDGEWAGWDDQAFRDGQRDALAFILYSADITHFMGRGEPNHGLPGEELLREAYARAGAKDDYIVHEVARPEIEATREQEIFQRLESGKPISRKGLGKIIESDALSDEAIDEIRDAIVDDVADDE